MSVKTIDNYRLVEVIGSGRSPVYRAQETTPDGITRDVAVKVMPPLPPNADKLKQSFLTEARALFSLSGKPHIVGVLNYGVSDDATPWIAMELASGSLADAIEDEPTPPARVAAVLSQTLQGLSSIHAAGLLHNDMKPQNVLLDERGNCKITDFGLASLRAGERTMGMATVRFAAPEIINGESDHLGPSTDLYSLGHMMYELALGRRHYREQFAQAIGAADQDTAVANRRWMQWHCSMEMTARPVAEVIPGFPRSLSDVIAKLMAKPIRERYASADQALEAVEACDLQQRAPATEPVAPAQASSGSELQRVWKEKPALVVAAGVMVLVLLGFLASMLLSSPPPEIVPASTTFEGDTPVVTVAGQVLHPPRDATLRLQLDNEQRHDVALDADGRFTHNVKLTAAGAMPGELRLVRRGRVVDAAAVTLHRHPPQEVPVIVATEPPLDAAEVVITPANGRPILARTDPEGRVMSSVPYGTFDVSVRQRDRLDFDRRGLETGIDPRGVTVVAEMGLAVGVLPVRLEPDGVSFNLEPGPDQPDPIELPPGDRGDHRFKLGLGRYAYTATLEGHRPVEDEVTIVGGSNPMLRITLQPLPEAAPPAEPAPPPDPPTIAELDAAALAALDDDQFIAFLRREVPLEQITIGKARPELRTIRLAGPVLNDDELT